MVITYDEHGGLYDHGKPPESCSPGRGSWRGITRRLGAWLRAKADRKAGRKQAEKFDFRHLGVRVPSVLVSPWIQPGTIFADTLDHASIPRTLRELFAPDAKPLTNRDRAAKPFHQVVTESPVTRPRPSPGEPNPGNLPPVPDLSAQARPQDDLRSIAVAPPGQPAAPAPTSDVDRELVALAAHVDRRLRRHPTTVAASRRAAKQGEEDSLAASTGEVFLADHPVNLFRAAAKTARRRGATRKTTRD